MMTFSHLDSQGKAKMVDISHKPPMKRIATATSFIKMQAQTLTLLKEKALPKGDALTVARIAGIQAAKKTSDLIPLCHSLQLTDVAIEFQIEDGGIRVLTSASTVAGTGVEMEALTSASVAALCLYDMCKAVDKQMQITDVRVITKTKELLTK